MTDINHVVLVGRLTRDAELKYTSGGQAVSKFSLAVNSSKKNGDQWEDVANFFDIDYWGRPAEAVNQYLVKGKQVIVDGELRQDRWQDQATGQNRSKVGIHANRVELASGSGGGSGGSGYSGSGQSSTYARPAPQASRPAAGSPAPSAQPVSDMPPDDFSDDIPF
jgi:single-strand DNA-binding protein